MEFTPDKYMLGFWFVAWEDKDWMLQICCGADGTWEGEYRFRYYDEKSENPFDQKDRKSFYKLSIPGSEPADNVISVARGMRDVIAKSSVDILNKPPIEVDELLIAARGNVAIDKMIAAAKPWMHIKKVGLTGEQHGR